LYIEKLRNIRQEAQVQDFSRTLTGMAAAAALGAVLFVGIPEVGRAQAPAGQPAAQPAQPAAQAGQPAAQAGQSEKKTKDEGEYNIAVEVGKDLQGQSWQKAITDLNTWTQKYPESDFKDDRLFFYLQAYAGLNQHDKVLEYGQQLLAKDLKASFKDTSQVLQILYRTAAAIQQIPNPTPQQLQTGETAAKQLLAFLADPASKPANVTDAQWQQAKTQQLEPLANATLIHVAWLPGKQAMDAKDYPKAEKLFREALQKYPENGWLAYNLGSAIYSQKDRLPQALYYIARGVAMDPAKGGIADANTRATFEQFLRKAYTNYHGSDEGLDQLKQQALAAPNPPPDFNIKNATDIAREKQEQFAKENPQLALWMGIKSQLTAPDGEQYFASNMKDAAVPKLKGTVMGGTPECRSKEVQVAVPEPNQQSTVTPEITLKLDSALTGKPVAGTEIQWEGVPSAFSKDPFMLTMDTEKAKIEGLKTEPCTAGPAGKKGGATPKAPATKKKK
jgi:tetratricopeptide (TPR) repeat protein